MCVSVCFCVSVGGKRTARGQKRQWSDLVAKSYASCMVAKYFSDSQSKLIVPNASPDLYFWILILTGTAFSLKATLPGAQ